MRLLLQIFKTMEKSEFRVLIKHCFLMGKIQFKQSNGLVSFIRTLLRWKQQLRGGTDTNNAECSDRPNSAVVLENTKKLHQRILDDCKLKLREIAKELKISEGNVFTILHEHLSMRKLCSKWVQHLLTVDQKQQQVDNSEYCLQLFQCNKKEFFLKCVTIDETWIHHFTLEWTAAGESRPKRPKTQISAGKVLTSVFWDV